MALNQVHFGYCDCNDCLLPAAICSQEDEKVAIVDILKLMEVRTM